MEINEILEWLQKILQKYDQIFLVTNLSVKGQEYWKQFCSVYSILEHSDEEIEYLFMVEEGMYCLENSHFITLRREDAGILRKLYLTYEFSDCFTLFADSVRYGTIFYYVDTGILTVEEAVRAILGWGV